jgi:hypothetical protein
MIFRCCLWPIRWPYATIFRKLTFRNWQIAESQCKCQREYAGLLKIASKRHFDQTKSIKFTYAAENGFMLLLWWCPFKIQKEKWAGLQFNSTDYLSLVLYLPLLEFVGTIRNRWFIETGLDAVQYCPWVISNGRVGLSFSSSWACEQTRTAGNSIR